MNKIIAGGKVDIYPGKISISFFPGLLFDNLHMHPCFARFLPKAARLIGSYSPRHMTKLRFVDTLNNSIKEKILRVF